MEDFIPNEFNEQTRLLLEAFNTSVNGIIIIDHQQPDDPIIYCNPAFESLTGYKKENILGRNCRFLQGNQREQEGRFAIKESLKNEIGCTVELINYQKDGTPFWNEIHISPIRNKKGKVTHYVGIQNTITENQLNALHNRDTNLQQKDDFISSASHELKTPVTSLKASLQLLKQFQSDPEKILPQELIAQANKSVEKVELLINDLLNTSKFKDGQLQLHKNIFNLAKLIHDCCQHIRFEGRHDIIVDGDESLEVYADAERVDQVVVNMVINARKFSPKERNIHISINKTGEFARVFVVDKGPGIPKEEQKHIFERYFKADINGRQYAGLGLGLFISAEIIRKHGDAIGVDSEPGLGSSFWFTLPLS